MRKLTQEEMNKVLEKASNDFDNSNGVLRWGQALFNALYDLYPEVADSIRATEHDPFYKSDKCVECIDFITE